MKLITQSSNEIIMALKEMSKSKGYNHRKIAHESGLAETTVYNFFSMKYESRFKNLITISNTIGYYVLLEDTTSTIDLHDIYNVSYLKYYKKYGREDNHNIVQGIDQDYRSIVLLIKEVAKLKKISQSKLSEHADYELSNFNMLINGKLNSPIDPVLCAANSIGLKICFEPI